LNLVGPQGFEPWIFAV